MSGQLSGTYTFNPTAFYIIKRALRQCQVIQQDEDPANDDAQDALFALNSMIKAWQGSGIHVWCEQDITLWLQPKQTSYQLGTGTTDHWTTTASFVQGTLLDNTAAGATSLTFEVNSGPFVVGNILGIQTIGGNISWPASTIGSVTTNPDSSITVVITPMGVPQACVGGALAWSYGVFPPRPLRMPAGRRWTYAGVDNEIPLVPMSRLDYAAQPNKTTTGAVTQFFYDPQDDPVGVFYAWPTPADDTAGIKATIQRPLQDVDLLTNLVDFPKEWINCLTWNLALELGPEYDVAGDRWEIIQSRAKYWFDMASSWDRETGSVLFGFAKDPQYRAG